MSNGNGVSRGDRNRNARLSRLRELVRRRHGSSCPTGAPTPEVTTAWLVGLGRSPVSALGPRNPWTSPWATLRLSPLSALVRPKLLTRPTTSMTAEALLEGASTASR